MSKHSATGNAWNKTRQQVLARDHNVCNTCGGYADTVDHIVPRSKGGRDTMDNLVSMCRRCNSKKQDKVSQRVQYLSPRWFNTSGTA